MTVEKAKKELRKLRDIEKTIHTMEAEITRMNKQKTDISSKIEGSTGGCRKSGSKQEKIADVIMDTITENLDFINQMMEFQKRANRVINKMPKDRERDILRLYYLEKRTFEVAAEQMVISVRHAQRVHGSALQSFARMYSELYEEV